MVKAEITISGLKDQEYNLDVDLLKREDWTESEFRIAKAVEGAVIGILDHLINKGMIEELEREYIKPND